MTTGPFQYFICGGFGGICTVLVGHPMDTIKVRLQTMPPTKLGENPMYTGTWDCIQKTIKKEGFRGLYKGMGAPLVAIAPIFAISFFGYGIGKELFGPPPGQHFQHYQYFAAGAFSGIFTTTVMAPGERIKCLLQIQAGGGPKKYDGPMDAIKKLYKEGGIRSIYKGAGATLLRDVPASGLYYLTYETIKNLATNFGKSDISFGMAMIAGGCAGISNWIIGMPQDVIKSRLQTAPEGSYPNGFRQVAAELLKNDGPMALYKGFTPVIIRAFPANAACFLGFEMCRKFMIYCENMLKGNK